MNGNLVNSFFDSSNFCHLLITFGNNLDPDQGRTFDSLIVFLEGIFGNFFFFFFFFLKSADYKKNMKIYQAFKTKKGPENIGLY